MPDECANPLLLQWLKEWRDVARERGTKGATTYSRAYDSMKACPIEFAHPEEALQLHGLGPKLCSKLTDRLTQYNQENGLPPPKRRPRNKRPNAALEGVDDEPSAPKRQRKAKPYVPALRSGPYALVLGLATVGEKSGRGLNKVQLIDVAQEHCDSSFTVPSEAGKFYTAWASMKTLLSKDVVEERGRPTKKYYLTETGWELAERIKELANQGDPLQTAIHRTQETILISSADPSTVDARTHVTKTTQALPTTVRSVPTVLNSRPTVPTIPNSSRLPAFTVLSDDDDDDGVTQVNRSTAMREQQPTAPTSSTSDPYGVKAARIARGLEKAGSSTTVQHWPRSTVDTAAVRTQPQSRRLNPPPSTFAHIDDFEVTQIATPALAPTVVAEDDANIPTFAPITIPPGEFTIELVVDTREVRSVEDRNYIKDELLRRDIKPTMRSLELGDALWTAKLHRPAHLGLDEGSYCEIMLDWILERKRLDDLIASIKDGRFYEQKFRLRKCGVPNVVYLIEECTIPAETQAKYGEAVETAVASTQLVNGFFVKRTAKLDDTIRYLARMTELLRKTYEAKPLKVIPSDIITLQNYLPLQAHLRHRDPNQKYHIGFATFSALCSKSETLTLRDVFLKMLMCVRGVSAEKALEIQRRWATPRAFWEAYQAIESGGGDDELQKKKRREMVFERMGGLVGRKKIGKALSGKVAEIWAGIEDDREED